MKLCILGGGGFRTPYVYQALLRDGGSPRITEVALYDIDEDRLRSMTMILEQFAIGFDDAPKLLPTTSLRSAVEGSDFVFAAIRVGGLEGRRCDEHVALDLNVIGQETTGPGGLAYAIRTVPVMMEVARLVKELAPQAYLMNFTNPPASSPRPCSPCWATGCWGSATRRRGWVVGSPGCSGWITPGCRWTTWGSTTWAGCGG